MYFPKDMTVKYFFFNTYIGYFLQVLPIALIVSIIYWFIRFRKKNEIPVSKKLVSCVFVWYITGLICLVIGLDMISIFWHNLFYHMNPSKEIMWFGGSISLVPNFINNVTEETIGNLLMFFPFGFLYPLLQKDNVWKKTVITGILIVVTIEVIQPIFGRIFDMNDVILNSLGIIISTSIFILIKKVTNYRNILIN